MNTGKLFTVIVIAIICSTSAMFVLFNSDEVEAEDKDVEATIRNNSDLVGEGTETNPWILYVSAGDSVSLTFEGLNTVTGLPASLTHVANSITGTTSGDAGLVSEVKLSTDGTDGTDIEFLTIENRTLYNSINNEKLVGYGTENEPWKYYVRESSKFLVDFGDYGSPAPISNMPSGISQTDEKLEGVLGEDSVGDYNCLVTIDENVYHLEILVIQIFPSWIPIVLIVAALVIFSLAILLWSSKYGVRNKDNQ